MLFLPIFTRCRIEQTKHLGREGRLVQRASSPGHHAVLSAVEVEVDEKARIEAGLSDGARTPGINLLVEQVLPRLPLPRAVA